MYVYIICVYMRAYGYTCVYMCIRVYIRCLHPASCIWQHLASQQVLLYACIIFCILVDAQYNSISQYLCILISCMTHHMMHPHLSSVSASGQALAGCSLM